MLGGETYAMMGHLQNIGTADFRRVETKETDVVITEMPSRKLNL
jgi:hypothetical protein